LTDEQLDRLANAIIGHGNNLADNLVLLKKFLQARQEEQQKFLQARQEEQEKFLDRQQHEQQAFLAEQRLASDKAQTTAKWTAVFAALAACATAIAAAISAYADIQGIQAKQAVAQPAPTSHVVTSASTRR
jgi:phage portal protein BeeE